MLHPVPEYLKVGLDLFDYNGKSNIVVMDYFFNYPEAATRQSTFSKTVISYLITYPSLSEYHVR